MTIKKQDWELSQRGLKDAARHREKMRESIQENIADIISDASIITRKKGRVVRVPIRGLKSYRFIYKQGSSGGTGVGQGQGEEGDIIGRQPNPDGNPGQAGDQPGVDYLETEIDIDELIKMMLEDLGLPNLQQKEVRETIIPKGWKVSGIEKTGPISRLDKKRTLKAAIQREAAFVKELMRQTKRPEKDCRAALTLALGNILEAKKILLSGQGLNQAEALTLFTEDLRIRTIVPDQEHQSNAVVLAMMDVSGSMGTMKKYLARSFYFWLLEFLKKLYQNVQIRFIAHTTEAKLVDEHEFFHKGESGGTFCYSAYDLAIHLVETEYPPSKWNIYPFHFSDGEDFEPARTVASAIKLINLGVNMLGYGEIQIDQYASSSLMDEFFKRLNLDEISGVGSEEGFQVYHNGIPFLGAVLRDKSHVYLALQEVLKKERQF